MAVQFCLQIPHELQSSDVEVFHNLKWANLMSLCSITCFCETKHEVHHQPETVCTDGTVTNVPLADVVNNFASIMTGCETPTTHSLGQSSKEMPYFTITSPLPCPTRRCE